jgi:hypothetical protein
MAREELSSPSFLNFLTEKSHFSQPDHFDVPEIKLKYMNGSYFLFFNNQWVLIKSEDQLTCGQHTVTFDYVPEHISLPFEVELEESEAGIISFRDHPLAASKDPLFFLYNTPAHTKIDSPAPSSATSGQNVVYLTPPFWNTVRKHPPSSKGNQVLIYNPPEENKKAGKTGLIHYLKQSTRQKR